jgi:hypothetical protein
MISERKLAANRSNAKRSTGPRTAYGKLQARRNALQHGLATIALRKPALAIEIEHMSKAICRGNRSQMQFEQSRNIAENELMLLSVRAARLVAIQALRSIALSRTERIRVSRETQAESDTDQTVSQEEALAAVQDKVAELRRALSEMARYDRYERRAVSRRQRAIRTFVATSILGSAPSQPKRISQEARRNLGGLSE